MIESEIKLPLSETDPIVDKLLAAGFHFEKLVTETDTYFNGINRDFAMSGEAFRLRRTCDHTNGTISSYVTYKGPKLDQQTMTRLELETRTEDGDVTEKMICALGFHRLPPVQKQRRYMVCGRMHACVDNVENLGHFLELEIILETEAERPEARKELDAMLNKIGYKMSDTIRTSYLSMLQRKGLNLE